MKVSSQDTNKKLPHREDGEKEGIYDNKADFGNWID